LKKVMDGVVWGGGGGGGGGGGWFGGGGLNRGAASSGFRGEVCLDEGKEKGVGERKGADARKGRRKERIGNSRITVRENVERMVPLLIREGSEKSYLSEKEFRKIKFLL